MLTGGELRVDAPSRRTGPRRCGLRGHLCVLTGGEVRVDAPSRLVHAAVVYEGVSVC